MVSSRVRVAGVVAGAAAAGFVALSVRLAGTDGPGPAEASVRTWATSLLPEQVTGALSELGSPLVLAAAAAVTAVAGWRWRRVDLVALSVVTFGAAAAVPVVLKPLVGRTKSGHLAFPSGHSTGALCTAALLAALVAAAPNLSPRARTLGWCAAGGVAVAGGSAPVLDGFHWPADSLGSLLWVAAVLAAFAAARDLVAARSGA